MINYCYIASATKHLKGAKEMHREKKAIQSWIAMLPEVLRKGISGNTNVISAAVLVNAVPMGKARPRFTRKGRCYTPKTTQQAEQQVQ